MLLRGELRDDAAAADACLLFGGRWEIADPVLTPASVFAFPLQDDDEGDEGESKEDKAAAEAAATAEAKDKAAAEGEKESKPELEEGEVPPTPPTAKQVGCCSGCHFKTYWERFKGTAVHYRLAGCRC
jgi:hypothetical protein